MKYKWRLQTAFLSHKKNNMLVILHKLFISIETHVNFAVCYGSCINNLKSIDVYAQALYTMGGNATVQQTYLYSPIYCFKIILSKWRMSYDNKSKGSWRSYLYNLQAAS